MKKIGMRNIKTGIAVLLATIAGYIGIIQFPLYTVSVCIFSVKNTVKDSLDDSVSRILGTLLGGFIGYIIAKLVWGNMFITPLGVILVIHLCNIFKISDSAGIASVTFSAILLGVGDSNPLLYSVARTIDTLVGVLIALLVNFWVSRRKYLKYLCTEFNATVVECKVLISHMVKRGEFSRFGDLEKIFDILKMYYTQLIDEVVYSNETGDLADIKRSFDICEQLLHHVHGLNILEKKLSLDDDLENDSIYKYHLDTITNLIQMLENFELNLEEMLEKEVA